MREGAFPERKPKVVHDSIYGTIVLSSIEDLLITDPRVFRLNYISQTSLAYMSYPNATHTRLTHSLGVLHLSSTLLMNSLENALTEHTESLIEEIYEIVERKYNNLKGSIIKEKLDEARREIEGKIRENQPTTSICIDEKAVIEKTIDTIIGKLEEKLNEILSLEKLAVYLSRDKVIRSFRSRVGGLYSGKKAIALPVFYQAFRLAALCHDLGHYPFSHTLERALHEFRDYLCELRKKSNASDFERVLCHVLMRGSSEVLKGGKLHEAITLHSVKEIFYSSELSDTAYNRFSREFHDLASQELNKLELSNLSNDVRERVESIISEVGGKAFFRLLLELLGDIACELLKGEKVISSISDLISGGEIDADRMDYIMRDALFTGIGSSSSEISRVISLFTLAKEGNEFVFAPSIRSLGGVEALLLDRMRIYKYVHLHHRILLFERLLEKIIVKLMIEKIREIPNDGCYDEYREGIQAKASEIEKIEKKIKNKKIENIENNSNNSDVLAESAELLASIIYECWKGNRDEYSVLLLLYPLLHLIAESSGKNLDKVLEVSSALITLTDHWLISLIKNEYLKHKYYGGSADGGQELKSLLEIFQINGIGVKSLWKRDADYLETMRNILEKDEMKNKLKLLLWASSKFGQENIRGIAEYKLKTLDYLESLSTSGVKPEELENVKRETEKIYLWTINIFLFENILQKSDPELSRELEEILKKKYNEDIFITVSVINRLKGLIIKPKLTFIQITTEQRPEAKVLNSSDHLAPINSALSAKRELSFPFNIYYKAATQQNFPEIFKGLYEDFLTDQIKRAITDVIIPREACVVLLLTEGSGDENSLLRNAISIENFNCNEVLLIHIMRKDEQKGKMVVKRGEKNKSGNIEWNTLGELDIESFKSTSEEIINCLKKIEGNEVRRYIISTRSDRDEERDKLYYLVEKLYEILYRKSHNSINI